MAYLFPPNIACTGRLAPLGSLVLTPRPALPDSGTKPYATAGEPQIAGGVTFLIQQQAGFFIAYSSPNPRLRFRPSKLHALRQLVEELKTPGIGKSRQDKLLDIILANIS